jgi:hypothetical protein
VSGTLQACATLVQALNITQKYHGILKDDLNTHQVTHPMVPWMLTDDHSDECMTIYGNLLMTSDNDPLLLVFIIMEKKTW